MICVFYNCITGAAAHPHYKRHTHTHMHELPSSLFTTHTHTYPPVRYIDRRSQPRRGFLFCKVCNLLPTKELSFSRLNMLLQLLVWMCHMVFWRNERWRCLNGLFAVCDRIREETHTRAHREKQSSLPSCRTFEGKPRAFQCRNRSERKGCIICMMISLVLESKWQK